MRKDPQESLKSTSCQKNCSFWSILQFTLPIAQPVRNNWSEYLCFYKHKQTNNVLLLFAKPIKPLKPNLSSRFFFIPKAMHRIDGFD